MGRYEIANSKKGPKKRPKVKAGFDDTKGLDLYLGGPTSSYSPVTQIVEQATVYRYSGHESDLPDVPPEIWGYDEEMQAVVDEQIYRRARGTPQVPTGKTALESIENIKNHVTKDKAQNSRYKLLKEGIKTPKRKKSK